MQIWQFICKQKCLQQSKRQKIFWSVPHWQLKSVWEKRPWASMERDSGPWAGQSLLHNPCVNSSALSPAWTTSPFSPPPSLSLKPRVNTPASPGLSQQSWCILDCYLQKYSQDLASLATLAYVFGLEASVTIIFYLCYIEITIWFLLNCKKKVIKYKLS